MKLIYNNILYYQIFLITFFLLHSNMIYDLKNMETSQVKGEIVTAAQFIQAAMEELRLRESSNE